MSNKKEFQKKANAIFLTHPNENKVFISKNGQCFFDEKTARDYHDSKGFDEDPIVFFREGFEDEDDQDVFEALAISEQKNKNLETLIEDVTNAADLDKEYEPVNDTTSEVVTAVIGLREKYVTTNNLLIEANSKVEKLENVSQENENLKSQLEVIQKQLEVLQKPATNSKTK